MTDELPVLLKGRPFTTEEARRYGMSRHRLRAPSLATPFHGVRSEIDIRTTADRAAAVAPRLGADQWITGYGAAAIWGLPLPARRVERVEITVAKSTTRVTGRGIRARELKAGLVRGQVVDGIPVTDPLLTWCTLAKHATVEELIRVGDALVSANPSYVGRRLGFRPSSVDDLHAAATAWKGCNGAEKLRTASRFVRPGVASPAETDMRLTVLSAGVPEFEINQPVYDTDGRQVAIVDGLLREVMLVFEYEGDGHRSDVQQFRRDITRYGELDVLGYVVCRATADDLYRLRAAYRSRVLAAYQRALQLRSARSS